MSYDLSDAGLKGIEVGQRTLDSIANRRAVNSQTDIAEDNAQREQQERQLEQLALNRTREIMAGQGINLDDPDVGTDNIGRFQILAGSDLMRAGAGKPEETKYVLYFEDVSTGKAARVRGVQYVPDHGQGLVLRKALAYQINEATGTDDTDHWAGKRVVIYGCKTKAQGKEVVSICARAPKAESAGSNGKAPTTTATTQATQ